MKKLLFHSSIFIGCLTGMWATASMLAGLASVNWDVLELVRQYLMAAGLMQEFHTFSDFYTHVKGVEYIIAASFLGAFPAFYCYLNRSPEPAAE